MIDIISARLSNERLIGSALTRPEDVVSWLGAVQAQEYGPARWGLAQRMASATDAAIEKSFDDGGILRTHVLRPTWHFVTPADIRWILQISGPRVHTVNSFAYRTTALDAKTRARGTDVMARALEGHRHLTRVELAEALRRAKLPLQGQALAYMVMHAELEGVLCSGPRRGKQFTYALLDERVPKSASMSNDEALAELAARYFESHGPATIRDFVWWSGLTVAQAKTGIGACGTRLTSVNIDDKTWWHGAALKQSSWKSPLVHLLPIYDEFLIAFKDREWSTPVSTKTPTTSAVPSSFFHQLVIDGRVEGSWTRTTERNRVIVTVVPFGRLSQGARAAIEKAGKRYAAFLGLPVALTISA